MRLMTAGTPRRHSIAPAMGGNITIVATNQPNLPASPVQETMSAPSSPAATNTAK